MNVSWESEISRLLSELSSVQEDLLELLNEKRNLLVNADTDGLASIGDRERKLIDRLRVCHDSRSELLQRADQEGLPSNSIQVLTGALPSQNPEVAQDLKDAKSRFRLLHHHSLTNWVLVQRTLIHLSQMLEIIATGGRPQPTYEMGPSRQNSGSIMDHAV